MTELITTEYVVVCNGMEIHESPWRPTAVRIYREELAKGHMVRITERKAPL